MYSHKIYFRKQVFVPRNEQESTGYRATHDMPLILLVFCILFQKLAHF